jgi:hypothetical protein
MLPFEFGIAAFTITLQFFILNFSPPEICKSSSLEQQKMRVLATKDEVMLRTLKKNPLTVTKVKVC